MSYILVRINKPMGDIDVAAVERAAGQELAPELFTIGCQRFTTVKLADGHIGSTSVYADEAATDWAVQIAT